MRGGATPINKSMQRNTPLTLRPTSREASLGLIRMVDELPSLPDRYARIREVIECPKSDAIDLAHIVATDQATTAMVLKFANSPAHNPLGNSITSLPIAIARLGTTETAHIAMTMSLIYGFAIPGGMLHIRAFWAHAFAVALLSKRMATLMDFDQDTLFTVGLLHDIGRAVLGIRVDMDYFESDLAGLHGEALIRAEQEAFGLNHAEAGSELLKRWELPAAVYDAVALHHAPETVSIPVRLVQLADAEANRALSRDIMIDQVDEFLSRTPERPRELLQEAGLIAGDEEPAD